MTARLCFEHELQKCNYLKADDVIKKSDHEYAVRSETNVMKWYTVNENGFCECEQAGLKGKFCKHLFGVYKFHGTVFSKMPPITIMDRQSMAYVAFGSKQPDLDFFLPLHANNLQEDELKDIEKANTIMNNDAEIDNSCE